MIEYIDPSQEVPYIIFKKKYDEALNLGQKNIEAISISSFNKEKNEIDSRFVNLKFIKKNKFIFFSNYNSPKSLAFDTYDHIAGLFYWQSSNTQIRMKAKICKTSIQFNNKYFKGRSLEKNSLAISSNQSYKTSSYNDVVAKNNAVKENTNLSICPDYWGGFSFIPYYFEFWEGHESRLNKRDSYQINNGKWQHFILQP